MRSIWDCPLFLIPVLLFLIAALTFTWWYPYGFELIALNQFRAEPLNTFFVTVTWLGEFYFWLVVAIALAFYKFRYTLIILVAGAIIAPIAALTKHFIGIPRPNTFLDINNYQELVIKVPGVKLLGGYNSFPSGHTIIAFTMFSLITLMFYKKYPLIGLLTAWTAVLVGLSRVFLVQHFLTDVVAGALFGILISDFVWKLHLYTEQK
jgi:membrane-associated phospholipid phosphatase